MYKWMFIMEKWESSYFFVMRHHHVNFRLEFRVFPEFRCLDLMTILIYLTRKHKFVCLFFARKQMIVLLQGLLVWYLWKLFLNCLKHFMSIISIRYTLRGNISRHFTLHFSNLRFRTIKHIQFSSRVHGSSTWHHGLGAYLTACQRFKAQRHILKFTNGSVYTYIWKL